MSKRFPLKNLVAVALSLAVLCFAAAPAQAASWNRTGSGVSLWSTFVDTFLGLLLGPTDAPADVERKTTTTSGGTTPQATCPPGSVGCPGTQGEGGAAADPFGKP